MVICVSAVFDLDWLGCGACVNVCMRVLAVAEGPGCPGVVLGICPSQEAQARSPGQRSNTDKKAISVCLLFHSLLALFSPVVSEGSVRQIWGAWS